MIVIRLSRAGAKRRPFYHIVVTDVRKPRDSGYIEQIGFFNPIAKGKEVRLRIDLDAASKWISDGCKLSEKVSSLLKQYRKENKAVTVGE